MTGPWHVGLVRVGGPTDVTVHGGFQRECEICEGVKAANDAAHRSHGTVTLEEMTRRRDRWKDRAEDALSGLAEMVAEVKRLNRELSRSQEREQESAQNLMIMRAVKDAAQAEARRYAEECGRLRDELADQDESHRLQAERDA